MNDYLMGLDLGQAADYTALCVLEIAEAPLDENELPIGERLYNCRHLQRFALGTTYPAIVDAVIALYNKPPLRAHTTLVIDNTGVGRPVTDLFVLKGIAPVAVTITGGTSETNEGDNWSVPKRVLVSGLRVLLETKRIKFASDLPDVDVLVRELTAFRVKISEAGSDSYGAWREGAHDDLVLAVALAAWWGERSHPSGAGGFSVSYLGARDGEHNLPPHGRRPRPGTSVNPNLDRKGF